MRALKFCLVFVFSFILILCFSIVSYSQHEVLIITNKKNGKEKTIEQHEMITVWTITGEAYTGSFSIIRG
jgi:hypothetical protein